MPKILPEDLAQAARRADGDRRAAIGGCDLKPCRPSHASMTKQIGRSSSTIRMRRITGSSRRVPRSTRRDIDCAMIFFATDQCVVLIFALNVTAVCLPKCIGTVLQLYALHNRYSHARVVRLLLTMEFPAQKD